MTLRTVDKDVERRVLEALETIRPYLKTDGGDIELVDISDDHIVTVKLLGSCSTCNMSSMTMTAGVEEGIKKAAPEIKAVVAQEAA